MVRRTMFAAAVLTMATLIVFWPLGRHEFLTYDDGDYVTENPHVAAGLTAAGVVWAFTATRSSNWHPLTWLSHMLDVQLFGMDAGKHHVTNLLLHLASTVLLFLVFVGMTGTLWRSVLVAALFAVHPLHVESVAWVAERKDVLSGFFWMLTLGAYLRYARRPAGVRYGTVVACLAMGLMAKPMLVTLPLVLLLLDFWPLRRLAWPAAGRGPQALPSGGVVREKIPLLALCAVSSAVTYWAQHAGGSVSVIHQQQLGLRLGNAFISYAVYLGKTLWPSRLAVFYPLPDGSLPVREVVGAGLLLAVATFVVMRQVAKRPYLAAGWLWFAGTLIPVIGLVQVGEQAMADRYMYLPMVGLSVIVAWGMTELAGRSRVRQTVVGTTAALWLTALAFIARSQAGYWKDSITLFQRALAVTERNYIAHANLGRALVDTGRLGEGVYQLRKSLEITPLPSVLNNLGLALKLQGRTAEAQAAFARSLAIEPAAPVLTNLGVLLYEQGDLSGAVARYREALRLDPESAFAHNNLGAALWDLGARREAMAAYREAIRLQPEYVSPVINLGDALLAEGRRGEAADLFRQALRLDPTNAVARSRLAEAAGGAP